MILMIALRAGLFGFDVIAALPQVDRILSDIDTQYGALEPGRLTHELVRRLISVFVSDLLATSHEQLAALGATEVDGIRHHESPVICFSAEMARDLEVLREFLFTQHVAALQSQPHDKQGKTGGGQTCLTCLCPRPTLCRWSGRMGRRARLPKVRLPPAPALSLTISPR